MMSLLGSMMNITGLAYSLSALLQTSHGHGFNTADSLYQSTFYLSQYLGDCEVNHEGLASLR
jgi:hypothetical protein